MRYLINGVPVTKTFALSHLQNAYFFHGGDPAELRALWARAHTDGEDGEDARDVLADLDGALELIPAVRS